MTRRTFRGHRGAGWRGIVIAMVLLLACAGSCAAQNLLLQLTPRPVTAHSMATRAEPFSVVVASGERVHFARAAGHDTRLRAGSGFTWAQVEDVPRSGESLTLVPTQLADGSVEVRIAVARLRESRLQRFSSTVRAQPGEWLQLYGTPPEVSTGARVYRTPAPAGESLYLRVEPH